MKWVRNGILCLVTAVWAASATDALAQNVTAIPPPLYTFTDANGVDLASGNMGVTTTAISVGAPKTGLSFSITYDGAANYGYGPNFVPGINSVIGFRTNLDAQIAISTNPDPNFSDFWYTVSIGERSEKFLQSYNPSTNSAFYINLQQSGSTLSYNISSQSYVYTATDGTIYNFQYVYHQIGGFDGGVTSVTKPDGEVLNYFYTNCTVTGASILVNFPAGNYERLQAITSSRGYQVHFTYDATYQALIDSVTIFNEAIDYCDPMANSCNFSSC